jgi:hypothetical protein
MHIVGISGPIESGKTTFAELLVAADPEHSAHLESSTIVMELCNEFNAALAAFPMLADPVITTNRSLGLLLPTLSRYNGKPLQLAQIAIHQDDIKQNPIWYEKLYQYFDLASNNPDLITRTITPANKLLYRTLMQWIGGYFLYRLDDSVMWYRELGDRISKLSRSVNFVALTAPRQPAEADYVHAKFDGLVIMMKRPHVDTDTHETTERRVNQINPDITIINNGKLADLQIIANMVAEDIKNGAHQNVYTAA